MNTATNRVIDVPDSAPDIVTEERPDKIRSYSRDAFLQLHFTPIPGFDGAVTVFSSKKRGDLYEVFYCPASQVAEKIRKMHFAKQNYYITPDSHSGHGQAANSLYGLHNVVIDIDCHEEDVSQQQLMHCTGKSLFMPPRWH